MRVLIALSPAARRQLAHECATIVAPLLLLAWTLGVMVP